MLGILLAVILLIFGYSRKASGTSGQIAETAPTPRLAAVLATNEPPEEMPEPTPDPTASNPLTPQKPQDAPQAKKPVRVRQSPTKPIKNAYSATTCARNPKALGCCVDVLKQSGDLPKGKVTKDGLARTIPTKKIEELKPGTEMVVKTTESAMGHVVKVRVNNQGEAVSIREGGHSVGEGRVVPKTVIVGEVVL